MPTVDCILVGHSFVRHLERSLQGKYMADHPSCLERRYAQELKVDENIRRVFLVGKSGATVMQPSIPRYLISRIRPQMILLEYGSNELSRGERPTLVADKIFSLAADIGSDFNSVVGILSVVPREGNLKGVNPVQFMASMMTLERLLKEKVASMQKIFYHKHQGFYEYQNKSGEKSRLPVSAWSDDAIHPARPRGMERYKKSIRAAIFKGLKLVPPPFSK